MAIRFAKLDRLAVRRLMEGETITESGITAERVADGDVRWSVNVMVDGQRVHRVIGRESEGVTRTQCEEFIEQAKTDARAGRLSLPKGRKLALTVAAAADDYLKRLEQGIGKNVPIKRRQFRMYLKPFFGTMRLDAVTTFSIDRYKKKRQATGASNATINRELAALSHLFSMAVEWKWLTHAPCPVKKLKESEGRIIALTDSQCDALMRAAVKSADPDCWLFVAFGLNTAMRHSEIVAARFDQVDFPMLRLFVPDAKAGQREQPITPQLASMLLREREAREDKNGWIFLSPHNLSESGHRNRMSNAFRDAAKAADLNPELVTPHVMRHTAITALVKARVDLPTIQKISGHKTLAMVMRYAHVHGDHIDMAISAIGRTLPEPEANETGNAISQELHTRRNRRAKSASA